MKDETIINPLLVMNVKCKMPCFQMPLRPEERLFDWVDYTVFGAMLVLSVLIGVYFAILAKDKQASSAEYLMGGRSMGIFPISMSLIARYIVKLFVEVMA